MSAKILVADDEAHILHVLAMKLRNAGYEVITAMDGEEALDLCIAEKPDMIITDYQMPFISGLEFCTEIQTSNLAPGVPILMLTARGFDISPEQRAQAGLKAVLAKPFSPREVLEKVSELLTATSAQTTIS